MAYSETGNEGSRATTGSGAEFIGEGAIRRASQRDLPRILQLLEAAYQRSFLSEVGATFSSADVLETVTSFLSDQNGLVLISPNGLCAGHIAPSEFSKDRLTAHLIVWLGDHDAEALRLAFEDWALSQGAQAVHIAHWEPGRAGGFDRLLGSLGYTPLSFTYSKDLEQ
ncbi:MAG: hypothetical protein AAF583_15775 [Pseudomonadota bacterium]